MRAAPHAAPQPWVCRRRTASAPNWETLTGAEQTSFGQQTGWGASLVRRRVGVDAVCRVNP